MRLDHFFEGTSDLNRWTEKPPLTADFLLKVFGIPSDIADGDASFGGVSVFSGESEAERNENATAWYAKLQRNKVGRVFALGFFPDDVERAGLASSDDKKGETGFIPTDDRHLDLVGTRGQFLELVKTTLRRLNQNEDVIRIIPLDRIRIQLESMALAGDKKITSQAKKRILKALNVKSCHDVQKTYDSENAHIWINDKEGRHEIVVVREVVPVANQAESTVCRCVYSRVASFFRQFRGRKE